MKTSRTSPEVACVAPEQIAFGLGLFVEAANGQIPIPLILQDSSACQDLFNQLLGQGPKRLICISDVPHSVSLYEAFRALWQYLDQVPQRFEVCARVFAFYLMMERSEGAITNGWVTDCPENVGIVLLDPAVVEAIGTVGLRMPARFDEALFTAKVHYVASLQLGRNARKLI